MADKLKQHRVIGIRHALKEFKEVGLVDECSLYPSEAVANVQGEILAVARTWYEIGAKRGAIEMIEAILDGKFDLHINRDNRREIIAKVKNISWNRRLNVTVGNKKQTVRKRRYKLSITDLDFK